MTLSSHIRVCCGYSIGPLIISGLSVDTHSDAQCLVHIYVYVGPYYIL